jgi:hypothetical protein
MNADQHILNTSKHYSIIVFRCKCIDCSISESEYQDSFTVSYIRKGNFIYDVFRNSLDAYNEYFLIDKPGFEHTVKYPLNVPDASNIFVSSFHFSRIFKTFTSYSPYQYLLNTRLKNAEIMLKTTGLSITEISFTNGFNNLENFSAAFRKKFRCSPQAFRLKKKK